MYKRYTCKGWCDVFRFMTDQSFEFCPVCDGEVEDISDEPAYFEIFQMGQTVKEQTYRAMQRPDKIGIQG